MRNARIIALALTASAAPLTHAGDVFSQGFETDTAGWFDSSNGWSGNVARVASGTNGIASASGGHHAHFTQTDADAGLTAGFTRFDGYRNNWSGGYTASVDVYLDTSWAAGEGFDYSVASNTTGGVHLRDFIFHVAMDSSTGQLLVGGSNNTSFDPRQDLENGNHAVIGSSGWYTLEHMFYEAGDGSLAVAMNVYNSSGMLVFTEIRNTAGDLVGSVAGGNRYGWFTNIDVLQGINVDNVTLSVVPLPPAAMAGLGLLLGCAGIRGLRRR